MQKLKITLNEDGSVYQFTPDFKIMRGSYRNVLINIEVPHSLLLDPATDENGENQTGNDVRVGAVIKTVTGKNITTKGYKFQRVKDFTRDGVDYRLYQRKMPKIFTMWDTVSEQEATEGGKLTLVINVINWLINDLKAKIEEISASPKFTLEIQPSAFLEDEEIIEPSDFDGLNSQVQEIDATIDELQNDLYGTDGLGDFLTSRLNAGNKITLEKVNGQVKISVQTIKASEVPIDAISEVKATNVQTAIEELSKRTDSQQVDTLKGEDDYLVDNSDPRHPIIMHDKDKIDVDTYTKEINALTSAIQTNKENVDTINKDLQSYSLVSNTGAKIVLDIDTTSYLMTLKLKNANDEVLDSATIDFPLESMVVGASYSKGKLTLTLQNGSNLDIDISSIMTGLVNTTEFEELSASVKNLRATLESEYSTTADMDKLLDDKANLTDIADVVRFSEQNLSEAQKKQVRDNIGAGDSGFSGEYTDLSNKPKLNTNNSNSLPVNENEEITSEIELHRLAKTGALADTIQDSTHRTVTDIEKANWNKIETVEQNVNTANTNINTLNSNLATETTNRTTADEKLQTNITNEINTRSISDQTLQKQITENADDIASLQTSKANDSAVVHKTTDETIDGTKNFTGIFKINGGTISYDATTDTFTI